MHFFGASTINFECINRFFKRSCIDYAKTGRGTANGRHRNIFVYMRISGVHGDFFNYGMVLKS